MRQGGADRTGQEPSGKPPAVLQRLQEQLGPQNPLARLPTWLWLAPAALLLLGFLSYTLAPHIRSHTQKLYLHAANSTQNGAWIRGAAPSTAQELMPLLRGMHSMLQQLTAASGGQPLLLPSNATGNAALVAEEAAAGLLLEQAGSLTPQFSNHLYDRNQCQRERFPPGNYWFAGQHWDGEPGGAVLHGTLQAQAIMWKHQHPVDCSDPKLKFLFHNPHGWGMGSQIHLFGAAMATAMKLKRIYIGMYHPVTLYTNGPYCEGGPESRAWDRCFFEPYSSCTPESLGVNLSAWEQDIVEYRPDQQAEQKKLRMIRIDKEFWPKDEKREVPPQLLGLLGGAAPIPEDWRFRWWRAQAATYMVRLNERTKNELERLRHEIFTDQRILPGTIAVHVRHGDKAAETRETPNEQYWERTQRVQAADPRLRKRIFLHTYDPRTVQYFEGVTQQAGWTLQYTNIVRNDDNPGLNTVEHANQVGPTKEALQSFLNLRLALECDAWVATLSSNWGRLIDELRDTVRCGANHIYFDAQQSDPPDDLGVIDP